MYIFIYDINVQEKFFLDAENKDVQNNETDVERSMICQMIEQNSKLLLSINCENDHM